MHIPVNHLICFSLELPQSGWIDGLLDMTPTPRRVVSMLYMNIQRVASPSLVQIKAKWEDELEFEKSDVDGRWAVELIHSSSVCVRHGLIQFKVLHRLHLSRDKLAGIQEGADPTCPRCKQMSANISHMFCSCPRLKEFWTSGCCQRQYNWHLPKGK